MIFIPYKFTSLSVSTAGKGEKRMQILVIEHNCERLWRMEEFVKIRLDKIKR